MFAVGREEPVQGYCMKPRVTEAERRSGLCLFTCRLQKWQFFVLPTTLTRSFGAFGRSLIINVPSMIFLLIVALGPRSLLQDWDVPHRKSSPLRPIHAHSKHLVHLVLASRFGANLLGVITALTSRRRGQSQQDPSTCLHSSKRWRAVYVGDPC